MNLESDARKLRKYESTNVESGGPRRGKMKVRNYESAKVACDIGARKVRTWKVRKYENCRSARMKVGNLKKETTKVGR